MGQPPQRTEPEEAPTRYQRKMRAERKRGVFGRKPRLHCGGQLGGNLFEVFSVEELTHELMAPQSITSDSPEGAALGFLRETIHSRVGAETFEELTFEIFFSAAQDGQG